jgi:hypothetical protein
MTADGLAATSTWKSIDEGMRMTWIQTVPYDRATPEVQQAYNAVYALFPDEYAGPAPPCLTREDGQSDSIVAAHSLIPEAMRHMMSGLGVLLQPNLPLTRSQQEMIAAVVSQQNSCFY